jgi:uncharacterized membrane protein YgdD (TMEM256/DUF423 family)
VSLDPSNPSGSAPSNENLGGALFCVLGCAGLAGAAGVALGAVAAHKVDSPALTTAAMMLILHGAAGIAIADVSARMKNGRRWLAVASLMLFAAALFAAAVAFHAFTGDHLFPMAAPIGGSTLIASWLGVAVLAAIEWRGGT